MVPFQSSDLQRKPFVFVILILSHEKHLLCTLQSSLAPMVYVQQKWLIKNCPETPSSLEYPLLHGIQQNTSKIS